MTVRSNCLLAAGTTRLLVIGNLWRHVGAHLDYTANWKGRLHEVQRRTLRKQKSVPILLVCNVIDELNAGNFEPRRIAVSINVHPWANDAITNVADYERAA